MIHLWRWRLVIWMLLSICEPLIDSLIIWWRENSSIVNLNGIKIIRSQNRNELMKTILEKSKINVDYKMFPKCPRISGYCYNSDFFLLLMLISVCWCLQAESSEFHEATDFIGSTFENLKTNNDSSMNSTPWSIFRRAFEVKGSDSSQTEIETATSSLHPAVLKS